MRTNNSNKKRTEKPAFGDRSSRTSSVNSRGRSKGSYAKKEDNADTFGREKENRRFSKEKPFAEKEQHSSAAPRRSTDRKYSEKQQEFNPGKKTTVKPFRDSGKTFQKPGRSDRFKKEENTETGGRKNFEKQDDFGSERKSAAKPFRDSGKSFQKPSRSDRFHKSEDVRETRGKKHFEKQDDFNSDRKSTVRPFRDSDRGFQKPGRSSDRFKSEETQEIKGRKSGFDKPVKRDAEYNPHAKYSLKKQIEYKKQNLRSSDTIRLNRFLANAGICSRREADDYIKAGVITVNGQTVTELGTKVSMKDKVLFHDQMVRSEKKIYILLNKPKDCVTTSDDPQERFTVMDLIKDACNERVYPVGRLDRNTTGVLLLTNDGDMAARLTHPKYNKKKIYHVFLDKPLTRNHMEDIAKGVTLEDGEIYADKISYVDDGDKRQVGIEIHSGRNRIVRRIFEYFGYKVEKLDRVYFAGLTKKNVSRGKYRFLTDKEINILQMGAFE